jgi:hypothetical protein
MLRKTASKWPVPGPPTSDAGLLRPAKQRFVACGARSDATLSHPLAASGLVPGENLMLSDTLY